MKQEVAMATIERFTFPERPGLNVGLKQGHIENIGFYLIEIADVARKIANGTTQLFKIRSDRNKAELVTSPLGIRLARILPTCASLAYSAGLYFDHEPHVQLLMSILKARAFPGNRQQDEILTLAKSMPYEIQDGLNSIVDNYRREANSRRFLHLRLTREANIKAEYIKLRDHLRSLDEAYPSSHVVSLELGHVEHFRPIGITDEMQYRRMHSQLANWQKSVRDQFIGTFVGGAWKIDASGDTSLYSAHVILILKCTTHSEINNIVDELGMRWLDLVGNNGYTIHCNSDQHTDLEYKGFNWSHKQYESIRSELNAYAIYMAKTDEYLQIASPHAPDSHGLIASKNSPGIPIKKVNKNWKPDSSQTIQRDIGIMNPTP